MHIQRMTAPIVAFSLCALHSRQPAGTCSYQPDDKVVDLARVVSTGTTIDSNNLTYPYYEWSAEQRVITWNTKEDGSVALGRLVGTVRNGRPRVLRSVSEAPPLTPIGMIIVPDGTSILYLLKPPREPAWRWRLSSIDGVTQTEGKLLDYIHSLRLVCKRDSSEWVALVGSKVGMGIAHYNLRGNSAPYVINLRMPRTSMRLIDGWLPEIVGLRNDGVALIIVRRERHIGRVNMYSVDVDTGLVENSVNTLRIPDGRQLIDVTLSHHGKSIAWLLEVSGIRKVGTENILSDVMEVWSSHSDGNQFHRLATVSGQRRNCRSRQGLIAWTSDDKQISIVRNGQLHLINVAR